MVELLTPAGVPPLFLIEAHSLYDAGYQQGVLAASRIRGWLSTPEMKDLLIFTAANATGSAALAAMVHDNTAVFPDLVDELGGIADGARVPMAQIWVASLIVELEALMPEGRWRDGHCSDIFAAAPGAGGVFSGHNEDWPGSIRDHWYLAAYRPAAGATEADVPRCAGLVYPGGLIGWAPGWNGHGVYQAVNSLFPKAVRAGGLGSAFVQRRALCGGGSGVGVGGGGGGDALSASR